MHLEMQVCNCSQMQVCNCVQTEVCNCVQTQKCKSAHVRYLLRWGHNIIYLYRWHALLRHWHCTFPSSPQLRRIHIFHKKLHAHNVLQSELRIEYSQFLPWAKYFGCYLLSWNDPLGRDTKIFKRLFIIGTWYNHYVVRSFRPKYVS